MAFNAVLHQVIIMFALMLMGYILYHTGFMSDEACKGMSHILLLIVSPCVILLSFQLRISRALLTGFLISALSAFLTHVILIALSQVIFRRSVVDATHRNVLRFAVVYSNCGFMGIPLLAAVIGSKGVFYASAYIAVFNAFNWTHGVAVFTGKTDRKSLIKLLLNPNIIAVAAGFVFFVFSVRFPPLLSDGMKYLYDLNTPLAMLVLGGRMAKVPLRDMLNDKWIWPGVAIKNLAAPLLALFALHFAGVSGSLLLACLIPIACPVAGNTVLFADLYGGDSRFPSKIMAVSTALSVVTIPLIVLAAAALRF